MQDNVITILPVTEPNPISKTNKLCRREHLLVALGGTLFYNKQPQKVVSKCALTGELYMPSSGRKVAREA